LHEGSKIIVNVRLGIARLRGGAQRTGKKPAHVLVVAQQKVTNRIAGAADNRGATGAVPQNKVVAETIVAEEVVIEITIDDPMAVFQAGRDGVLTLYQG